MKKVGIIGCGGIAQVHGWVLQNMENAELAAVCDVEKEKAEALSKRYGGGAAQVYTDWHMLCESDAEVVHICTPHFLHAPMATELLRHGKSVFTTLYLYRAVRIYTLKIRMNSHLKFVI